MLHHDHHLSLPIDMGTDNLFSKILNMKKRRKSGLFHIDFLNYIKAVLDLFQIHAPRKEN